MKKRRKTGVSAPVDMTAIIRNCAKRGNNGTQMTRMTPDLHG
jgi:hypothetical protein